MTPHRTNQRGTLVLDRQFKGVGRIKRASGTDDPKVHALLDNMLKTLKQAGRLDILDGIRRGVLTPLEVWARFRLGELERLPSVETIQALKDALGKWRDEEETGAWNRMARRAAVSAMLKHAPAQATVSDVPGIIRRYRSKSAGAVMFNRVRAAALAFLRDTVGRSHPLYGQVLDVQPRKEQKREPKPFTVEELVAAAPKLGAFASCAWAMALTGMGPGEYWGRWTAKADRVVIYGTKRSGRRREIPLAGAIAAPKGTKDYFQKLWRKVMDADRVPYDLRHTFATWLEQAGIPRTRRRGYMGHGAKDVTDLYEKHEVTAYLAGDGEKLRAVVGDAAPKAGLRLA